MSSRNTLKHSQVWVKVLHVSRLWEGPEDEDLTVIELKPVEYDYMRTGDLVTTMIQA